jgi:hypothetical protein
MTQDDIIKLTEQVCSTLKRNLGVYLSFVELQKFAELIASVEREACAKVCEEKWMYTANGLEMADYIRERREEK